MRTAQLSSAQHNRPTQCQGLDTSLVADTAAAVSVLLPQIVIPRNPSQLQIPSPARTLHSLLRVHTNPPTSPRQGVQAAEVAPCLFL